MVNRKHGLEEWRALHCFLPLRIVKLEQLELGRSSELDGALCLRTNNL
jgi:hypothetical protein